MSTTSEETSSSEYSSESSEDDGMETAQACGTKLQLPQGLCEQRDIFEEFFTVDLWNSFSDEKKEHLQTFLPNFPENDDLEKTKTLQRLFDFENFRFSNPLNKFHDQLKAGYLRPDIARMRRILHKNEKKEAKFRNQCFKEQLKNEIIESQEKLLNQIKTLPPGVEPKQEKRKLSVDYVYHRTKKRYFQVLSSIKEKTDDADLSSDENYPEGPSPSLSRKQKRHLNSIRNSINNSKEVMFGSTMVAKINGFSVDFDKHITPNFNPFYINDESYKNMLHQHKRRKLEKPEDPELEVEEISITDIVSRTKLPFIKNLQSKVPLPEPKTSNKKRPKKELPKKKPIEAAVVNHKPKTPIIMNHDSNSDSDIDSLIDAITIPNIVNSSGSISKDIKGSKIVNMTVKPAQIKEEIKNEPLDILEDTNDNFNDALNIVPSLLSIEEPFNPNDSILSAAAGIKMEDLEHIDIMNTPIELDNSDIDLLELSIKPELMQDTHANFFSLIRDVICSTNDHRMNMYTLQERLKAWQENPISPLNDWYSYVDNWINILPSAITFLCGNASEQPDDFVPYMEYKALLDVYQWIGAGRDSDPLLSNLCTFWLQHRTESKLMKVSEIELDIADRDSTPPPPRCPTTWTVRKASLEEIREYREQERRRYDNPHKAFTFRCNGYESVVGPLKGIYNPATANTKARGHNMLNADRPNFVTILSLVRDATARLPNGEGTRSDICELLKSSQYISSNAPDNILQSVVSGALDRMHTQWDPCVKYDQKRKIWIYLHRHRTEDDFERIHQHYQGVQKSKKNARKSPAKSRSQKSEKQAKSSKQQSQKVSSSAAVSTASAPSTGGTTQQVVVTSESPCQVHIEPESLLNVKEEIVEVDYVQETTDPQIIKQLSTPAPEIISVASPPPKTTSLRRQSLLQNKMSINNEDKVITAATPGLIMTSQKSTSLLLSNNPPKQQEVTLQSSPNNSPTQSPLKSQSLIKQHPKRDSFEQESEMMQISVTNPIGVLKGAAKGSMVKIVSPSHGKSVIIPTSNPQILKQIQERPTKSQQVSQPYLQGIPVQSKQQKTVTTKGTLEVTTNSDTIKQIERTKIPVSIQQQVVQGLTSQQLHNIKNVTLLRTNSTTGTVTVQPNADAQQSIQNVVTVSVPKGPNQAESVQIKTPSNLTPAQTQQILQTIKQKYLPNANVLTPQQQMLLKQKGGVVQLQKTASLTRPSSDNLTKPITSNQGSVVAKVLTNAAGQVISVESLLAHQKAHGTLPQGTTLRVHGSKAGQQNIIHLTSTTKPNTIAHFTVGTQNNLVALTTQPKLVVASQASATTTVTPSKPLSTRTVTTPRTQQISKASSNVTQHLINAKIITSDGQKIVQPKVMVGGNQALKVPAKTGGGRVANIGNNSLRMLNTANINLTTIDGKPVLLASKSGTIQNIHGQNVIVQAHQNATTSSLVLQSPLTKKGGTTVNQTQGTSNVNVLNQSGNIVFSPTTIKNQLPQQVLFSSQSKNVSTTSLVSTQSHIVLGSQPIRLQTSNASGSQRVVLASQGQGGQILAQQILLPAGFQGTAINIKSLQGVKVIPITQNPGKGQSRQIFAKVMSPSVVKQQGQTPSVKLHETLTIHSSESE